MHAGAAGSSASCFTSVSRHRVYGYAAKQPFVQVVPSAVGVGRCFGYALAQQVVRADSLRLPLNSNVRPLMQTPPEQVYLDLMSAVRDRLDVVGRFARGSGSDFARAETAAFHGRKIVEGIAFGCLVATERGLKHVPRDAKGQWNAETILNSLSAKNIKTFPSPSVLRKATDEERRQDGVAIVVEGAPDRRISNLELVAIYQRLHRWLHELNPYVAKDRAAFYALHGHQLWDDLSKVERLVERHFISISGHGFFCVLRDSTDGATKVLPLSKSP
jgi:hypothetical protein